MRLYEGSSEQFTQDVMLNQISDKLKAAYERYYHRTVGHGEKASWDNSLRHIKDLIVANKLQELMMVLEYELPYSNQRIDCTFFGKDTSGQPNVVVLELKQWDEVKDSEIDGNVVTYVGGGERDVEHPSLQVKGYHDYLLDYVSIFEETPKVGLSSAVYCHNYAKHTGTGLYADKFKPILSEYPLFSKEDVEKVGVYLKEKLAGGGGLELFDRFITTRIKPTKRLVDYTRDMLENQKVFTLIDEQIAANNAIIDRAKKCSKLGKKSVVVVQGGPGTGKSVIALNALAELLSKGQTVFHATGSAAFTRTLRKLVGTRAASHFKFFNSDLFKHKAVAENSVDVLICDEAHRIRQDGNSWRTPKHLKSEIPQIEELVRAAKVSIFFVDDNQVVRPKEVGSSKMIREAAAKYSAQVFEYELTTQFRCSGSNSYLDWVDDLLGIIESKHRKLSEHEKMEFKIFDSPQALYDAIRKKNEAKPNTARLVAGFCWPWSDPKEDGTLKKDVVIGDFAMSWEGKDGFKLAKGIPPAPLWAYDPDGVDQIGSIYTIQGFEFDYVGVIIAKDLVYNPEKRAWEGHSENSSDSEIKQAKGEEFTRFAKNVYRTLLTRGMKGCYVYFLDKDTENYIKNRIEPKGEKNG